MDNQFFKQKLKESVKEYLNIDNEINTLQAAIKERKKKKEELVAQLQELAASETENKTAFQTLKKINIE